MKAQKRPATALRRLFLRRSVPYFLFAIACALSLAASWYLSATAAETARVQARSEFFTDAQQTRRQLQAGLNSYLEIVRAGAGLVSAKNEINGAEFRRFVEALELPERYPGLRGLGFAHCVQRQELDGFLRVLDLDGSTIQIWPDTGRSEHCPVIFLEPAGTDHEGPIGFDLASIPDLVRVMDSARDTGQPVLSGRLSGVAPFEDRDANVVLFFPVYRERPPLVTVEARRRLLLGFVFSPIHTGRLIEDIVRLRIPSVGYEVYDGAGATKSSSLARSPGMASSTEIESFGTVRFSDREWLVAVRTMDAPVSIAPAAASQTLVGGLILSFMLLLITRAQARAWETAARHEAELSVSAEALREREAQANAANRAKDDFLATLSHELRTPLNVVLGWVTLLRHAPPDENRAKLALEVIERNARQQAALIDDLLDVSRIVAGNLRLDLRPTAVAPIVAATVDALRPSADVKRVNVTVLSLASGAAVMGDPDRLRQTVWNLLSNAIKFTPADGEITVELTRDDSYVRLSVRDTGVGIAASFLPHVFERFRQADSSTTRAHSGVGLGLAIVHDLVELHGGTIEAHSPGIGCGATFTVTLPAIAMPAPALSLPAASQAAELTGVRVLLVDDDPQSLELLTEALTTSGAHVSAADSARHALERVTADGADVIVSDIAMPDEDGFWLMQQLRRLPGARGQTPAIALTALARSEDRSRVLSAGFQLHLAKPVQLHELQRGIAALAASRQGEGLGIGD